MSDASSLVWAAVIAGLTSVLVQIISKYTSKDKTDAEANVLTSGEWKRLYDEMSARVDKMEHELDIAKDYIQYLWVGAVSLSDQVRDMNGDPVFTPKRNFRGNDDFSDKDFEWIEGR